MSATRIVGVTLGAFFGWLCAVAIGWSVYPDAGLGLVLGVCVGGALVGAALGAVVGG